MFFFCSVFVLKYYGKLKFNPVSKKNVSVLRKYSYVFEQLKNEKLIFLKSSSDY